MRTKNEIFTKISLLEKASVEILKLADASGAAQYGREILFRQNHMVNEKISLLEWVLNENIRERCEMDSFENKDNPECANVLGRCMICKHYSESILGRT